METTNEKDTKIDREVLENKLNQYVEIIDNIGDLNEDKKERTETLLSMIPNGYTFEWERGKATHSEQATNVDWDVEKILDVLGDKANEVLKTTVNKAKLERILRQNHIEYTVDEFRTYELKGKLTIKRKEEVSVNDLL